MYTWKSNLRILVSFKVEAFWKEKRFINIEGRSLQCQREHDNVKYHYKWIY